MCILRTLGVSILLMQSMIMKFKTLIMPTYLDKIFNTINRTVVKLCPTKLLDYWV